MTNPIKTAVITYDENYRDNSIKTILRHTFCDLEKEKTCYKSNSDFETVTKLIQKLFTEDESHKPIVKIHNYWICLEYYGRNEHNVHTYIIHGTNIAMERLQCINDYYNQEILVKSN